MTYVAELEQRTLTDEERAKFLDTVRADKTIGNVAALKKAGVEGTRGELRRLLDEDTVAEARAVRGWSLTAVEQTTWDVAQNPEHPSWDRANARILKAYHPAFQDHARVELTGANGGPLEVTNPDVAAAIERFTASVVHLATRAGEGQAAGDADAAAESRAGLPVGRLASET